MQKTKKEGYALIYVMCIMLLLTAFATSILALELSNRVTTSNLEKNNKARLLAQTGMETAVSNLKKYIADNFNVFLNRTSDNSTDDYVNFENSYLGDNKHQITANSYYTFTYGFENTYKDKISGLTPKCITITATGNYGGVNKTITAYIDENDISNIYFDKMFSQPLSVDSKIPDVSQNNLADEPSSQADDKNASSYNVETDKASNICMVTYKSKGSDDNNGSTADITLKTLTDDMYNYIEDDKELINSINISAAVTSLNSNLPGYIDSLGTDINGNTSVENMIKYSYFYKVLLVKGDLDVTAMEDPLINYVIYCTGNVNVEPGSNLKLWNSNIYAKNITCRSAPITQSNPVTASDQKVNYRINKSSNEIEFLDSEGKVITDPSKQPFQIKAVANQAAQTQILQYILGYNGNDSDDQNPYNAFKNQNAAKGKDSNNQVFSTEAAAQFSKNERNNSDTNFYNNIDGYAYGLKLRYIYWNEN